MKKVFGWKVPCKSGKHHSVGIFSGICSHCRKQIFEPDLQGKKLRKPINWEKVFKPILETKRVVTK